MSKKCTLYIILAVAALAIGGCLLLGGKEEYEAGENTPERFVIGQSSEGRAIESYTFLPATTEEKNITDLDTHLVFVAGIHGGYEWNTVVLAERFMEYLTQNPNIIPENMKVSVIPMANPDGVVEVFGTTTVSAADAPPTEETTSGRFNARGVDLNRNFDCNWEPESFWRGEVVDAGTEAFSEPEAAALRNFVEIAEPTAMIFWHSAANGVYGASCGSGISFEGQALMNTYADASGYPAIESFDHYEITGDAEGWLAKIGIPSVSVELETHETIEWEQNLRGIKALLDEYGVQSTK